MPENNWILGADIGGSHITAAMVDPHTWSIQPASIVRNGINSQEQAKTVLQNWAKTLLQAAGTYFSAAKPCLGIAMPGPFDYGEGISGIRDQNKYDHLYGVNVKQLLAKELDIPASQIRFINDAAAFLQGEIMAGNHQNSKKALGITLGTGFGSAFWEENSYAVDAELWHAPFKQGITEEYISAPWLINTFYKRTGTNVQNVKELAELAKEHATASDIFYEFGQNLADFLDELIKDKPVDTVIIGGNIAKAWPLFMNGLARDTHHLDIRKSKLGEEAAMVGAASLFA